MVLEGSLDGATESSGVRTCGPGRPGDCGRMAVPLSIEAVGAVLAIRWDDGSEHLISAERLREESPSAENKGEVDVLGRRWGGDGPRRFPGVTVTGWSRVGNYALSLTFSDGHASGIYSWNLLRSLAQE